MNLPISDSVRPMGRPKMNVKMTAVRLGLEMPARIDAVLRPREKRADLIREAIEKELALREGGGKQKPQILRR